MPLVSLVYSRFSSIDKVEKVALQRSDVGSCLKGLQVMLGNKCVLSRDESVFPTTNVFIPSQILTKRRRKADLMIQGWQKRTEEINRSQKRTEFKLNTKKPLKKNPPRFSNTLPKKGNSVWQTTENISYLSAVHTCLNSCTPVGNPP